MYRTFAVAGRTPDPLKDCVVQANDGTISTIVSDDHKPCELIGTRIILLRCLALDLSSTIPCFFSLKGSYIKLSVIYFKTVAPSP